uniref:Uncharacterized protein n=1 Tax=Chromera velia CCMP2878 TaxID=1169474 RepID=A0A0G4IG47_9ALVE|eukprot:Cvel_14120.t1-p1 / transcript=Cvel_14120.t1 / gene=Cvel_14120 / organism=Chromera_velia_CCMP2878 / gene_product=hypothetical protein / transcript_product=hypothetical protein / location=Cvel_scaffold994:39423-43572(+) / protein_length=994 / sequence_SO=supercontig / SO=protein_coding / is_pseudo=false
MSLKKVTFLKLLHQPPVEIEIYVGKGALFPLRLVCKDFNDRILSEFGVTPMTIDEMIVLGIGPNLIHWLMDFVVTPPSEALLRKIVEIKQGPLLLLLHKYPETTFPLEEDVPRRYIWNRNQVRGFSNVLSIMEGFAINADVENFMFFNKKFKRQVLRHLKLFFKKCAWHAAEVRGLALIKCLQQYKTRLRASFGDETDVNKLKRIPPDFVDTLMRERFWNADKKMWEPCLHLHLHPTLSQLCLDAWRGNINTILMSPMPDPKEFQTRKPIHPPLVVTRLMWYAIRGGHNECAKKIWDWGLDRAEKMGPELGMTIQQYKEKVALPRRRGTNKPPAEAAAREGNMEMLRWMRSEECDPRYGFDQWVVKAAIEGHQVDVLQYIVSEIPIVLPMNRWSRKLPDAARAHKSWACLRWLREQDPPVRWGKPEPGQIFGHGTSVARRTRLYEVKLAEFVSKDKVNDPPLPPEDIREDVCLFIRKAVTGTTLLSAKRVLEERDWRLFNWLCRMGGHEFEERRMVRLGYMQTVEIMRQWVTVLHWHLTTKWPAFVHGLERAGQRYDKMVANLNRDQDGFCKFHLWVKSHMDNYEPGLSKNAKRSLREIVKHSGEEHLRWMLEEWSPWDRPAHLQPRIPKQPMWLKRRRRRNKIKRRRRAARRRQEREAKLKKANEANDPAQAAPPGVIVEGGPAGAAAAPAPAPKAKAKQAAPKPKPKAAQPKAQAKPKAGPASASAKAKASPQAKSAAKAKAKAKAKIAAKKAAAKARQTAQQEAVFAKAKAKKALKDARAKAKAKPGPGLSVNDRLVIKQTRPDQMQYGKGLAGANRSYAQHPQAAAGVHVGGFHPGVMRGPGHAMAFPHPGANALPPQAGLPFAPPSAAAAFHFHQMRAQQVGQGGPARAPAPPGPHVFVPPPGAGIGMGLPAGGPGMNPFGWGAGAGGLGGQRVKMEGPGISGPVPFHVGTARQNAQPAAAAASSGARSSGQRWAYPPVKMETNDPTER